LQADALFCEIVTRDVQDLIINQNFKVTSIVCIDSVHYLEFTQGFSISQNFMEITEDHYYSAYAIF
jgi:hypothetical protein